MLARFPRNFPPAWAAFPSGSAALADTCVAVTPVGRRSRSQPSQKRLRSEYFVQRSAQPARPHCLGQPARCRCRWQTSSSLINPEQAGYRKKTWSRETHSIGNRYRRASNSGCSQHWPNPLHNLRKTALAAPAMLKVVVKPSEQQEAKSNP